MRRLLVTSALLLALAAPFPAAASLRNLGVGTLVVRGADNGEGLATGARPVATIVIDGFVIGRIAGPGRIEIYSLDASEAPEVNGAAWHQDKTFKAKDGDPVSGTVWGGSNLRFRAVGGTFRVLVWGSGVYLFAGGRNGTVVLTGQDDPSVADGEYSFNGASFRPIPLVLTRPLAPGPVG